MAIKIRCGGCGAGFTAKAALAGKRLPCPKCKQPIQVPKAKKPGAAPAAAAGARSGGGGAPAAAAYNPLLDLLDEAGVESTPQGPVCESCGKEISMHAVVCVNCGFNRETGRRLETAVYDDDDGSEFTDSGMTDAEKLMARAEQDIEDMPVTGVGEDFGDGADSFVIAAVAGIVMAVLVVIGVGTIIIMDTIGEHINPAKISFYASCTIALGCIIWITIVAFLSKSSQGMICLCTLGLYCVIFGFMQGKALILPTIILLLSLLIGLASGIFGFQESDEFGMLIRNSFYV